MVKHFLSAFTTLLVLASIIWLFIAFIFNRQESEYQKLIERLDPFSNGESLNCDEVNYVDRTSGDDTHSDPYDDIDDGYGDWNRTWFSSKDKNQTADQTNHEKNKITVIKHCK